MGKITVERIKILVYQVWKPTGKDNVTKDKAVVVQPTPVDAGEGAINEKEGLNKNQKKRWRKKKRDEASTSGIMQGQAQDRPAENDSEVTKVVNISETETTKIGTIPEENRPSIFEERLLAEVFGDDEREEKEDHEFVDAVDTNVEQNKANDEVPQGQCSLEVHQDIQGQYDDTNRIEDILAVKVIDKSDRIIEEVKIIATKCTLGEQEATAGFTVIKKRDMDEISSVVHSMKGDNSPGPDGFQGRSTMITQLWEATRTGTLVTLWKHRNLIVHEDKTCSFFLCTSMIRREVRNASRLVTGHSMNCIVDLQTLNA
ncbi:hypothetical protein IFM89_008295 [Coptis chinensis]|uniref:Uncharacterized protein n=1 Tax=Coptis chinensis TaxID=261450 RepID=A0A835LYX5_9MAGN|nr:hypothetical protein IFM89_008295 [Coptis chinensis]